MDRDKCDNDRRRMRNSECGMRNEERGVSDFPFRTPHSALRIALMRIGILGGTFNPVHCGHLVLARGVLEALKLHRVLWVPARVPPMKSVEDLAPAEDRCRMVELAIAGILEFELCRLELDRDGPSYTVDTLRRLRRERPGVLWHFLIGSDLLPELPTWRQSQEALTLATFVVVSRPSVPIASLPPGVQRLDVPTMDVSSSEIRQRVKAGRPIRDLVPEPVAQYIVARQLYQ